MFNVLGYTASYVYEDQTEQQEQQLTEYEMFKRSMPIAIVLTPTEEE